MRLFRSQKKQMRADLAARLADAELDIDKLEERVDEVQERLALIDPEWMNLVRLPETNNHEEVTQ